MTLRFDDRGRPAGLDWTTISGGAFGNPDLTTLTQTGAARDPIADMTRKRKAHAGHALRIPPDVEAKIIADYELGMTTREVGELHGVRANTVSKILRRNGAETRTKSEAARVARARRTEVA